MIAAVDTKMRRRPGPQQLRSTTKRNPRPEVRAFIDALGMSQTQLGRVWGVSRQRVGAERAEGTGPVLHILRALDAAGDNAGQAIAVLSRSLRQRLMDIPGPALWNRFKMQTVRECEAEGKANAAQAALATDQSADAYRTLSAALTAHAGALLTLATTAEEIANRKEDRP